MNRKGLLRVTTYMWMTWTGPVKLLHDVVTDKVIEVLTISRREFLQTSIKKLSGGSNGFSKGPRLATRCLIQLTFQ